MFEMQSEIYCNIAVNFGLTVGNMMKSSQKISFIYTFCDCNPNFCVILQ